MTLPIGPDQAESGDDAVTVPFIIGWMNRTYEGGIAGLCTSFGLDAERIPFFQQLMVDWFPLWIDQREIIRPAVVERDITGQVVDPAAKLYVERMGLVSDPNQQRIMIQLFDHVLNDWQKITVITGWADETYLQFGGIQALAVSSEYGLSARNAVLFERFIVEWFPFWLEAQQHPLEPLPVRLVEGIPQVDETLWAERFQVLMPWVQVYQSYLIEVGDQDQQRIFSQLFDRVVTDWQGSPHPTSDTSV